MANNPPPDPVDSGFDDPEQFIKTERQLFSELEKSREKARKDLLALNAGRGIDDEINRIFAPSPSLKPWPLAFTIFGLGLIFAVILSLLSGCSAHTMVFYPNGKPKLVTNTDADSFRFGADGSLAVTGMKHSTEQDAISRTITARSNGIGGILGAAGAAALFH